MMLQRAKDFFDSTVCFFSSKKSFEASFIDANIQKPSSGIFSRRGGLPQMSAERLTQAIFTNSQYFGPREMLFEERVSDQKNMLLSELTGCLNSKSVSGDFSAMRETFRGTDEDMIALKEKSFVKPLEIDRFGENSWWCNNDGSHRMAAMWSYDRENGINTDIPVEITEFEISSKFLEHAEKHDIWLFSALDPSHISKMRTLIMQESQNCNSSHFFDGIEIRNLKSDTDLNRIPKGGYEYSMVIPHDSELCNKVRDVMHKAGAFNFSDWIQSPQEYDFDANSFISSFKDDQSLAVCLSNSRS